jgi:hypothetical protein
MSKCDPSPQPISRAIPELPPKLHDTFEGHSVVQFVIGSDGQVHEPRIESSEWIAVGRAGPEPEGYESAILAAISKWRYPPREESCRATAQITIDFDEG